MSESMAEALASVVQSVGREWKAAKRRADREDRVRDRDLVRLRGASWRTTIKEVAFRVMEAAYLKASGGGRYPANARQIYYAARPAILAEADADSLDSQYFTQELLKSYLERHRPDWDVVYDARGHFAEPHRKGRDRQPPVGLGGAEVRAYASRFTGGTVPETPVLRSPRLLPTVGPRLRFEGVLFIEKEGFDPILEAAGIADRYDLAVASTKGMPVSAVCDLLGEMNLPVYVVRDFDKAGFSIVSALRRGTRGSRRRPTKVVDLGLRLADVEGLEREPVRYAQRSSPRGNLRRNGASEEEIAVLVQSGTYRGHWGERVELNAMTSDRFIAWLERKLQEHGAGKLVPADEVLASGYRRALFLQHLDDAQARLTKQYQRGDAVVPAGLAAEVQRVLEAEPAMSWDEAVWQVASSRQRRPPGKGRPSNRLAHHRNEEGQP
jgi:hypothetical protein